MSAAFTRRQVLGALWGAPWFTASTGCARARDLPGSVGGQSLGIGHRLRDPAAALPQNSATPERIGVAIVGAGPAGLCAAWQLLRRGERDFRIFDLEHQAGGTSAYGTDGVVPHPWGAHYVPLPSAENSALVTLFDEMGVLESTRPVRGKERHLVRAPEERVFSAGAWEAGLFPKRDATPKDFDQWQRFTLQTRAFSDQRDSRGRRPFTIPAANGSDESQWTELDRLSAAEWLSKHGYDSEVLRWYVEYATRDDYGTSLAHTSAWAMLFYFASRSESSAADSAPFLTWPEGNGRIVQHLEQRSQAQLRLGRLVTDVVQGDAQVELSVLRTSDNQLERYVADQVIFAVPQFIARRVYREYKDAPPAHLDAFSYSAWLVANLHLSGRPVQRGIDLAWDSVIYESHALGYVDASHQTLRDQGPTVWTYYYPLSQYEPKEAREWLLSSSREDLVEGVVLDLQSAHPDLMDYVKRVDLWRWGHAMVRPTPGFIWGHERRLAAMSRGRVHFAHCDLSAMALFEEAQYWGLRAADAVLSQRRGT
ncbi:MAG: hypothetical protein RJA70_793 [Pseudomonadota bacterium]|jgi:protoporphyrinogen oxidase